MKTDSVLIKFKCGVNLRRFRALIIDDEFELSVPEFKQKAIALFSLLDKSEHLVLTYIDEHGDEVSLVDEDDLSDVVKQRLDPMRISVYHHSSRRSLLPRMSQPEDGNQLMMKKEAPKSSSFLCNNLNSCLVEDLKVDVTIRVAPSTPFKKIWRMKNIGRVEWPRKTELIWIGGDKLSNRSSFEVEVPLAGLPVGEEVDVVVDLTAPVIPDEYIAFWRLASPSGERFGQRIKVIVKVL